MFVDGASLQEWEGNVRKPPHTVFNERINALNGLRVCLPLSPQLPKECPHIEMAPARTRHVQDHAFGLLATHEVVNVRVLAGHTTRNRKYTR